MCAEGLREAEVIRRCAAATGELPGGLSLSAVLSRDFTHRLVVEPELLRPGYRRVNTEAKVAFVELVRQRIRRTPCNRLLPRAWDMDTWAYRCDADRGYVANLKRILDNLSAREEVPSVSLMAWGEAILPPGFEDRPERLSDPSMHSKLKFERRMRNRMGVFVAYEWVEITTFERDVLNTRYPEVPSWFAQYEVPADFIAEVPPCLVYYGLRMMEDPQSPRWIVFLSEWLAIVAKRFLWTACDGRLYVVPHAVVEWLRRWDLTHVLGGAARQERVQGLLNLHAAIDWPRVPYTQGHHFDNPRARHYSPGRGYDAGNSRSGNWVRLEAGTFSLAQPEYLREAEAVDAGSGGAGGRIRSREDVTGQEPGGVRVRRRGNEPAGGPCMVRVRRPGVGYGRGPGAGRDRMPTGGPVPGTVGALGAADVVMVGTDDPGASPATAVECRDPTSMSDAELRTLLSNPRLREKLRRLVTEEASVETEGDPAPPAERVGASTVVTATGPTVVSGETAAGAGSTVPEEDLADYEEEGAP